MGRHTAVPGAAVHPLVAAALEGRTPAVRPVAEHEEGPLGWPGQPGDGTGLGWPVDPRGTSSAAVPADGTEVELPARRRGWRRLFSAA